MRLPLPLEVGLVSAGAALGAIARRVRRGPQRPGWSARTEIAQSVMRAVVMRSKHKGDVWMRAAQAAVETPVALAKEVRFEPATLGGVPGEWCVPIAAQPERTVVYLHGGGYVIGSVAGYRDVLARLAVGARARVFGVEYRLAPEHPFPAAQDDALAATRAVIAAGTPAARVALAGDSAGGALCVATLCSLRDAGEALPAAAALLCPWTEPYAEGGSMRSNELDDFGDRALLVAWAAQTGALPGDPRFTVANAKLAGLPPLLVQGGGAEVLYDQMQRFAAKAKDEGVDVEVDMTPDMFHIFQIQASLLPEGAEALGRVNDFLRRRVPAA